MPLFTVERINPTTEARLGERWQLEWDDQKFICRDPQGNGVIELRVADIVTDLDLHSLERHRLILEPSDSSVLAFEMTPDVAAAFREVITASLKAHPDYLKKRKVLWLGIALGGIALSIAAAGWGIATAQSLAAEQPGPRMGKIPLSIAYPIAFGAVAGFACSAIGLLRFNRAWKMERVFCRVPALKDRS
jgi:hypothetical protein